MNTEMGEYIVGAFLKLVKGCDFIDYNVRRPGGGLAGLNEIDVLGLDFKNTTVYLCEVTTHLDGLLYKDKMTTINTIKRKCDNLHDYAKAYLSDFPQHHYMFWSPVVARSVAQELEQINGFELVINDHYSACVRELQELATKVTHDTGNPVFRVFQILGHLR